METVIALGALFLLLGAACIVSWVLGDLNGARRMELLFAGCSTVDPFEARKPALRKRGIPAWIGQAIGASGAPADRLPPHGWLKPARRDRFVEDRARTTGYPFAGMPSLTELQQEADAIRSECRIWDDPELCAELRGASRHAGPILDHFGRSVEALQEGGDGGGALDPAQLTQMPRFKTAEPSLPSDMARTPDRSGLGVRTSRSRGASL